MNKEQLLEIINDEDEREWVEYKTNYSAKDFKHEIGEYISALSNSAARRKQKFAYMIWGVENDTRKIKNSTFKYDTEVDGEVFKHYLARLLEPKVVFNFESIDIDGNRVVVLTIPAAEKVPTEFDRERYLRIGSSKVQLRKYPQYEADLWYILNRSDDITEIEASRDDLTFAHLKNFLISKGNHVSESTFLKNYHLLTSTGKYNRMAEILADENDIVVNVMVFKGKDKTEYLRREEFGYTCLLWAYERAKNYIQAMNQTYIDTSVRPRREKTMFDFDAFNEAWINACVHNKWSESNHPGIYIYEDRMVIESQGGIPRPLTKNKFLKGVSEPVNKRLMDIFIKCNICEESGHGVPEIVNKYGKDAFEFDDYFIDVTIPFDRSGFEVRDTQNDTQNDTQKNIENLIIELIKINSYITKDEMAVELGVSKATITRAIRKSTKIVFVGSSKKGHWEIIDEK